MHRWAVLHFIETKEERDKRQKITIIREFAVRTLLCQTEQENNKLETRNS